MTTLPADLAWPSASLGQARAGEAAILLEIAQTAGSTLDLQEVLQRVAEKTAQLTGADRCSLWLLDETGTRLLPAALYGMDSGYAEQWMKVGLALEAEPLSQAAILTGEPVVILDAATDPRTDKRAVDFFGDKSILVVPLVAKGRRIGTLFLNHIGQPYHYSDPDIATVLAIASQSAVAIENAQLYEESRRQRLELLSSFHRIGEALATGLDLENTLTLVVEVATEMLRGNVGALSLLDADGKIAAAQLTPRDAQGTYGIEADKLAELARDAIFQAGPVYHSDLCAIEPDLAMCSTDHSLRTYLGVPLRLRGEVIGALGVFHSLPCRFSSAEVDLLTSFGAQAAIAIENARLFGHLQRKVEELSESLERNAELYADLELESSRLDVIFRNTSDAIFMTDATGRIIAFNPAAEKMTGWAAIEALGQGCTEVFPRQELERLSGQECLNLGDAALQVLADQASSEAVLEGALASRAGVLREVVASIAWVPDGNGQGPFALAVIRDVTRQREVDRLKADFVSMVSHELRTPLSVIKGYAATLLNTRLNLDSDHQMRFVRGINDASDRLTRLIDNVLSASRLESGRFRLNSQVVDLGELCRRAVAIASSSDRPPGLTCDLPNTPIPVRLDHDQTELVLLNLINNAVKYSVAEGEIRVGLDVGVETLPSHVLPSGDDIPRRWAVISVQDRGIGIPASQLPLIFDKFYRSDLPAVKRVGGTGLGLYICKSIVEAHGGRIWVESELGFGSTFYVALPMDDTSG